MACCSYILLTFIKLLAFILPSWASEKQPIKVVFRQKNSSPIQKQGSRKNYPWVSLEVFNRFSWSRWEGVWEMPAHGHGKESLGSIPAASLQKISLPAFPPAGYWPSPPPLALFGAGNLLAQRLRCKILPLLFQQIWGVPWPRGNQGVKKKS